MRQSANDKARQVVENAKLLLGYTINWLLVQYSAVESSNRFIQVWYFG
jgi:hypothetical protein